MKEVRGACPHDCPDTCAFITTVEGGRAVSIRGDPSHPITQGFLCVKLNHYLEWVYNPRRVLYPYRRMGPKGSGQFERITWEEALGLISSRFQEIIARYGPEAIMPYNYSGTLGILNFGSMDRRFFHRLGATRLLYTICSSAGKEGFIATTGAALGPDPEDIPMARLIILWGTNTLTSNPHYWPLIQKARRQGAKLIVIDPRRTRTASLADVHIPVKPGTDSALALGLMHVIIRENLYNADYVRQFTFGFEALKERVASYTPEAVADITGVPVSDIEALARLYAGVPRSLIRLNYGLQRHTNGGMAVRTIACLPGLTGAWLYPGCGALLTTSGAFAINQEKLQRPDLLPHSSRIVNMIHLGKALTELDDPPVKALFVYNSDPANSAPNRELVIKGLMREDLFLVVHDIFFTDTTRFADVVLPATSQLERLDLHTSYGHYYLSLNQPAIEPLGESVSNTELFRRLARAMGFEEECFRDSDEDLVGQALEGIGITWESLKEAGWVRLNIPRPFIPFAEGFPTPSGKLEFYSHRLEKMGLDPLPYYEPLPPSSYPLIFLTPSAHHFLNSSFGAVDSLRAKEGRPEIIIHPHDAEERGISEGDLVRVWNERGECYLWARVSYETIQGVVVSPSIWWESFSPRKTGVNSTTPDLEADLGRGATFYTNYVEIEKAGEE
ncbi:MAG: molybdopterin oxidoreductase family protein [Anaerolineae bacterium]|nr:molybdopterin oxidoreductase family protein [Anaerolineae bacterium]MDW8101333.1 molybdopterin oxidoreductase family protein [Anaerolineae bacterium]